MSGMRYLITALLCSSFAAGQRNTEEQHTAMLLDGIEAMGGLDRLANISAVTYIGST
jgi:hypothetical protein